MIRWFIVPFIWILFTPILLGQKAGRWAKIDSLINVESSKPFNGIILIYEKGKIDYFLKNGYSDIEKRIPLSDDSQFVIGSISKQITATLILREVEKGRIQLNTPIKEYLPESHQGWADSVTVHDLLCHTHGIVDWNKPSVFPAGEKFMYSQIGYRLLGDILEKLNNTSFANQSLALFRSIGLNNTFHPDNNMDNVVTSYVEDGNKLTLETEKIQYIAAGGFISTAQDLMKWNENLYKHKLLKDKTYLLMTTKQPNALRNHPIFGELHYGYGITVDNSDGLLQLGQTGYVPGFVSMDFYFPKYDAGVIVLENIAYDTDNIKNTFFYHTKILDEVRRNLITD